MGFSSYTCKDCEILKGYANKTVRCIQYGSIFNRVCVCVCVCVCVSARALSFD